MTDSYRRMDAGMNEIIPNLWLGDLHNATDANLLKSNNIHSILSVMRGKLSVAEVRPRFAPREVGSMLTVP